MKNIVKLIVVVFLSTISPLAFAGDIDHFELITTPEKASVGEAIDLTIQAIDNKNNIIKDYVGTILIFSESDKEAQLPMSSEDFTYTFTESDQGSVTFENSVTFYNKGKNDIHVYDFEDQTNSIIGLAEVQISEKVVQKKIDIKILSPENGLTIGTKNITISGTTKKNHQIKIILNNSREILTTSNSTGIFEKKIDDIPNGKSVIKAFVLNSDNEEVGNSKEIHIISDSTLPLFNKITILPELEVGVSKNLEATVYATKGLTEVSLIINDAINTLKEGKDGIYKGSFLSPEEIGEYQINLLLSDELGHKIKKDSVAVITTTLEAANTQKKKDICKKGDYTGSVFDGECGEKTETLNAPFDLGIKNLKIVELKTKSILTWDILEDAEKYEIYKKINNGEVELIDTVTENKYEIHIKGEQIKYDFFAVKALGKKSFVDSDNQDSVIEKEITGDLSEAVKIQTGPKEIILILLALILSFGFFIFSKSRKEV